MPNFVLSILGFTIGYIIGYFICRVFNNKKLLFYHTDTHKIMYSIIFKKYNAKEGK